MITKKLCTKIESSWMKNSYNKAIKNITKVVRDEFVKVNNAIYGTK